SWRPAHTARPGPGAPGTAPRPGTRNARPGAVRPPPAAGRADPPASFPLHWSCIDRLRRLVFFAPALMLGGPAPMPPGARPHRLAPSRLLGASAWWYPGRRPAVRPRRLLDAPPGDR